MPEVWRLLAFREPPKRARMRQAKNGKSWFRIFDDRDSVFAVARMLKAQDIPWICDKVEKRQPTPRLRPRASTSAGIGPQPTALAVSAPSSRNGGRRNYDQIHSAG